MSQQLVPPFNKKEVKELAVEGVNEGIAEGKVNIPAGGTKLYHHYVKANDTHVLTIISTDNRPFNSVGTISWGIFTQRGAVSVYVHTNSVDAPLATISATSAVTLTTTANDSTATIQYSDKITDTVTEL